MAKRKSTSRSAAEDREPSSYVHPEAKGLLRPEVGTQAQFKKKKAAATYRYDSSLSPELSWDSQNGARELGEWLLAAIKDAAKLPPPQRFPEPRAFKDANGGEVLRVEGLADAVEAFERLSKPFLNWAGKAERLSFDVPTLPMFVHERLSTAAILESVRSKKRSKVTTYELFGDPELPIHQQLLKAYEHPAGWTNRMILGDSVVVMNSLLRYEGLARQVQMIYFDPPYGVQFGSNFQPFVRDKDVKHGNDDYLTREPEMVKAYRDTWELGLHSYLTYLRDRLALCRELLKDSGSIFVQIGDQNLHHVRELLDEVFGPACYVVTIPFKKKGNQKSALIDPVNDYIVWYSRRPRKDKVTYFQPLFEKRSLDEDTLRRFNSVRLADGREFPLSATPDPSDESRCIDYRDFPDKLFRDWPGARLFYPGEQLTSGGIRPNQSDPVEFRGHTFRLKPGLCWKTTTRTSDGSIPGMERLKQADRLAVGDGHLNYKRFLDDFGYTELSNWWDGVGGVPNAIYVVQTNVEIIRRCMLMTTRPGDLVLDPTCGSGTTAYVAEHWGRRWITIDASRVPLALTRQRLLTATYPYYRLQEAARGPAGGFVFQRKQNRRGEEVGGIVPHITLGTIANNEPPIEEVLVDRPEIEGAATRVTGPFCVEATIPTPIDIDGDGIEDSGAAEGHGSYVDRMIDVLRRAPVLQIGGGKTVTLKNVRAPARTMSLSAEAVVDATAPGQKATLPDAVQESIEKSGGALPLTSRPVAIVFGPENGAVSEKHVFAAAREAYAKSYTHLYVVGFAIQPNARDLVENCESVAGIPATYVQATPDLMMGDLLKNLRSSQIFSVCGLPDVAVRRVARKKDEPERFEVELRGLDVFDPATMEHRPMESSDVPCWMLDSDYNGLCFHARQVFFPRTAAWDDLKRSLRGTYEDSVWDHLAGTVSMPFEAGEHRQVAVKVIDDRGNELLVVKDLDEGKS